MSDGNASTHVARTATLNLAWEFLLRTGSRFIAEKLLLIQTDAALFDRTVLSKCCRNTKMSRYHSFATRFGTWEKGDRKLYKVGETFRINIKNEYLQCTYYVQIEESWKKAENKLRSWPVFVQELDRNSKCRTRTVYSNERTLTTHVLK